MYWLLFLLLVFFLSYENAFCNANFSYGNIYNFFVCECTLICTCGLANGLAVSGAVSIFSTIEDFHSFRSSVTGASPSNRG